MQPRKAEQHNSKAQVHASLGKALVYYTTISSSAEMANVMWIQKAKAQNTQGKNRPVIKNTKQYDENPPAELQGC